MKNFIFFISILFLFSFSPPAFSQAKKWKKQIPPPPPSSTSAIKILEEESELLKSTLENTYKELKAVQETVKKKEEELTNIQKEVEELKKSAQKVKEIEEKNTLMNAEFGKLKQETQETVGGLMKLKPHLEFRIRPEFLHNIRDLSGSKNLDSSDDRDQDFFYGQRLRLGLEVQPVQHLSLFVQFQDSRLFGGEENTLSNEKNIDLHQGYAEVNDFPVENLSFKAGRMELSYGSERLIGPSYWSINGRAFDGGKISYKYKDIIKADVFGVIIHERRTPIGEDQNLYGLYLTSEKLKFTVLDLYFFYLEDGQKNETKQIATIGARAKVSVFDNSLVFDGEATLQFGKNQEDRNKQDHLATAYFADLNYTAKVTAKPFIGGFFCAASGDGNKYDNKSINFYPLFPSKHKYWGAMDLFSMSNLMDAGGRIGAYPVADLMFKVEFHVFQMISDYGKIYDLSPDYPIFETGESNGKDIGKELDIILSYVPTENISLSAGYSFFSPGNAVKKTLKETNRADWIFLQGLIRY